MERGKETKRYVEIELMTNNNTLKVPEQLNNEIKVDPPKTTRTTGTEKRYRSKIRLIAIGLIISLSAMNFGYSLK